MVESIYSNFIGKNVVVRLKGSGFKKFGKLTNADNNFVELLFRNGKTELTAIDTIESIKEDMFVR
ncbi:MAG: hypothetical protein KGI06_03800 [Candidatus Micrarchaeota archaeon]|nr:hypothetical protein [Candidatus Micrarchaeota archaeon]